MASIRDYKKVFSVQNMTTGDCAINMDYERFHDDLGLFTLTAGQYHLYKRVLDLLDDGHNVLIKIGYKTS